MARKKAKRKGRRASGGTHFVLKTEAFCKCETPRGTLGTMKRRLATACRRDPRAYIVDSKAKGTSRVVAKCGGAS
jgi:hypothetical protein